LLNPTALDAVLDGVDMVYHLAANPDVKFLRGDPTDKDLQQNILCTYNVLESMRRNGVPSLAFSSTSAIYGICKRQPIAEDQAPHPISLYGATKLSCEAMIGAFQHLFGMNCWIFRFANVVGPKLRKCGGTVIGDFIDKLRRDPTRLQIMGNGRQAKSYLLARECVEAMLFAVEHSPRGLHTFNVGCDDSLSVDRIAEMVEHALGLHGVAHEYTGGEGPCNSRSIAAESTGRGSLAAICSTSVRSTAANSAAARSRLARSDASAIACHRGSRRSRASSVLTRSSETSSPFTR